MSWAGNAMQNNMYNTPFYMHKNEIKQVIKSSNVSKTDR